ncbi:OmpA family protein [Deltaproteobacteria bacterium TL4]
MNLYGRTPLESKDQIVGFLNEYNLRYRKIKMKSDHPCFQSLLFCEILTLILVLFVLTLGGCGSEDAEKYKKMAEEQSTKLFELKQQLHEAENKLQNAEQQPSVKDLKDSVGTLTAQVEQAQNREKQLIERESELNHTIAALKTQLEQAQNRESTLIDEKSVLVQKMVIMQKGVGGQMPQKDQKTNKTVMTALTNSLKKEIESQQVKISEFSERTVVRLEEKVLFDIATATLSESGIQLLKEVGQSLKQIKNRDIQVEGHSDYQKIRSVELKEVFPTNLELSTARALRVARYLIDDVGLRASRVSIAGYGPHHPLINKWTPEVLQGNRRVEIALLIPQKIEP